MRIYGDITLDSQGSQVSGMRLENLGSNPLTAVGRIYFNTSTHKVYVWNGTSWIQVSSSADYTAGDGLILDINNKFHIHLYNDTQNTSGLQFSGGYLLLKVNPTEFLLDGTGLNIAPGGVSNANLAGSIDDSKLLQIVTPGKVAGSAVEDVFLRNDADDTTTGTLTVKDLVLTPETTPGTSTPGKMYYDSGDNKIYFYNGSGWQEIYTGSANVHSVVGTNPINVTPTSGDVVVSIPQATTIADGYLTSTDWNIFNNKQENVSWGAGLQFSSPTASVKLSTVRDPGLEFDSPGNALQVKLRTSGGILVDTTGLYLDNLFAGWQAVWNLDPNKISGNEYFNLSSGGSWTIKNNINNVSILQATDGTVGTSLVTMSNAIVQGNLDVVGDNTWLSSTYLNIHTRDVNMGYLNPSTGTPTDSTYLNVLRGSDLTVALRYNEILDRWEFTNDGITYYPIGTGGISSLGKAVQLFNGVNGFTFTHGLGDLYPLVQIYDATGNIIQDLEITSMDTNNVSITFDGLQDGIAVAIGGTGGGGGSSGKFSMLYNVATPPYQVSITAAMHGLGATDELYVQVMDNSSPRIILDEEDCARTVTTSGNIVLTFLGVAQGKVIILS